MFLSAYKQIGKASNVIIAAIIYNWAYPVASETKQPNSAGPNPIVPSQNIMNVDTA